MSVCCKSLLSWPRRRSGSPDVGSPVRLVGRSVGPTARIGSCTGFDRGSVERWITIRLFGSSPRVLGKGSHRQKDHLKAHNWTYRRRMSLKCPAAAYAAPARELSPKRSNATDARIFFPSGPSGRTALRAPTAMKRAPRPLKYLSTIFVPGA